MLKDKTELTDLFKLTHELVCIPSESFQEKEIVDFVAQKLSEAPWLDVPRIGDNIVAKTGDTKGMRLLLGGHTDTCLLYTSPSPRDVEESRMPSSA